MTSTEDVIDLKRSTSTWSTKANEEKERVQTLTTTTEHLFATLQDTKTKVRQSEERLEHIQLESTRATKTAAAAKTSLENELKKVTHRVTEQQLLVEELEQTTLQRTEKLKTMTERGDLFSAVENLEKESGALKKDIEVLEKKKTMLVDETQAEMTSFEATIQKLTTSKSLLVEEVDRLTRQEQEQKLVLTQTNQEQVVLATEMEQIKSTLLTMNRGLQQVQEEQQENMNEIHAMVLQKENLKNEIVHYEQLSLNMRQENDVFHRSFSTEMANQQHQRDQRTNEMVGWNEEVTLMSQKLQESKLLLDDIENQRKRKEQEMFSLNTAIQYAQQNKIALTLENARLMEQTMGLNSASISNARLERKSNRNSSPPKDDIALLRWTTNDSPQISNVVRDMSTLTKQLNTTGFRHRGPQTGGKTSSTKKKKHGSSGKKVVSVKKVFHKKTEARKKTSPATSSSSVASVAVADVASTQDHPPFVSASRRNTIIGHYRYGAVSKKLKLVQDGGGGNKKGKKMKKKKKIKSSTSPPGKQVKKKVSSTSTRTAKRQDVAMHPFSNMNNAGDMVRMMADLTAQNEEELEEEEEHEEEEEEEEEYKYEDDAYEQKEEQQPQYETSTRQSASRGASANRSASRSAARQHRMQRMQRTTEHRTTSPATTTYRHEALIPPNNSFVQNTRNAEQHFSSKAANNKNKTVVHLHRSGSIELIVSPRQLMATAVREGKAGNAGNAGNAGTPPGWREMDRLASPFVEGEHNREDNLEDNVEQGDPIPFDLSTDDSSELELNDISSESDTTDTVRDGAAMTTPAVSVRQMTSAHATTAYRKEEFTQEDNSFNDDSHDVSQMILGNSSGDVSNLMDDEDVGGGGGGNGRYYSTTTTPSTGFEYSLGAQAHHLQQQLGKQVKDVLK